MKKPLALISHNTRIESFQGLTPYFLAGAAIIFLIGIIYPFVFEDGWSYVFIRLLAVPAYILIGTVIYMEIRPITLKTKTVFWISIIGLAVPAVFAIFSNPPFLVRTDLVAIQFLELSVVAASITIVVAGIKSAGRERWLALGLAAELLLGLAALTPMGPLMELAILGAAIGVVLMLIAVPRLTNYHSRIARTGYKWKQFILTWLVVFWAAPSIGIQNVFLIGSPPPGSNLSSPPLIEPFGAVFFFGQFFDQLLAGDFGDSLSIFALQILPFLIYTFILSIVVYFVFLIIKSLWSRQEIPVGPVNQ